MDCDEPEFFARAGFPLDTVVTVPDQSEAEELLRLIGREEMGISHRREEYMDMLIKMLIMKLADGIGSNPAGESISVHGSAFDSLRAELYANAGSFGSVSQLAKRVNLSPSHFQQLYKERFGVSCYDDLLSARIKAAQYYLKNTALTVKEIAALCGYENDVCFMRLFKRKTGLTPMGFRGT
jgi:AraC family transcriptional regulator of arabinose operon